MARIQSLIFLIYFILPFLLHTSHAYQHRHLRRTHLYRGQGHIVDSASSQEPERKQQIINDLPAKIDEKVELRNSAIKQLDWAGSPKNKRWGGHHHHGDRNGNSEGSDISSTALEELQQKLDALNQTIQSLYDLLSSSFGLHSGSTLLPTTATSASTPTSTSHTTTSAPPSSTPTAYTTYSSSKATATISSTSNHKISSRSSTSEPTTSTAARYAFDPTSSSNVAVYYGQTDQTSNVPLSTICTDPDVDIIILAFVNKLSTGPAGYPTLNMGPHCWAATSAQTYKGATGLIDCVSDGFADKVKSCQNTGKKVLLSVGGAVGYSETTINSEEDAARIADNIWNLFGAGGLDNDGIMAIRPFGDVIFDGFDIDNEDGSTLHWPLLISTLRTHFQSTTTSSSSPYNKPYYLTATPQCPRPDASIPLPSMRTAIDFIFIQFYNNPSCNLNSPGFLAALQDWSDDLSLSPTNNTDNNDPSSTFIDTYNGVNSPRLYVGAPAFPAAGSGWVGGEEFSSLVAQVKGLRLPNLGGVMFWDGAYGVLSKSQDGAYGRTGVGRSYMGLVKDVFAP